jgi:transposase InsO family protein
VLDLVQEAVAGGARKARACELLRVRLRTVERWQRCGLEDRRPQAVRARPANALAAEERERVLALLCAPEYRDLSPKQIVPRLADAGIYLASESTCYRLLREAKLLQHRQRSRPASPRKPGSHEAPGPNRVWSWDISYLPTQVRGLFFYLYLVVDLYSRKVVGWQVHDHESSEAASALLTQACLVEGVCWDQLVLHADNGSPMKGETLLVTLQTLGVMPSFSRPSVSDDNPYSEALFRTVKYRPWYPERPFAGLAEARAWVEQFVAWYNDEHHHSAIRYVTPAQRHRGEDHALLAQRHALYQAARAQNPQRWTRHTRDWTPIGSVWLNPPNRRRPSTADNTSLQVAT